MDAVSPGCCWFPARTAARARRDGGYTEEKQQPQTTHVCNVIPQLTKGQQFQHGSLIRLPIGTQVVQRHPHPRVSQEQNPNDISLPFPKEDEDRTENPEEARRSQSAAGPVLKIGAAVTNPPRLPIHKPLPLRARSAGPLLPATSARHVRGPSSGRPCRHGQRPGGTFVLLRNPA